MAIDSDLTFGDWLRRQRRARDLTRAELAAAVGCSVSALRKFEADQLRPSRPLAEALASALAVAPQDRDAFVRFARDMSGDDLALSPAQTVSPEHPASPARVRSNLLMPPTALIGREPECAAVRRLLCRADIRLVTLTGPGGIGKTHLSLQVAAEMLDAFVDGIYFVDLAPIRDPNLVIGALAQTLGVRESGSQPLLERVKDELRDKHMLLLLDNFEQVLDAASHVGALLAATTRLKLLVTSRERLRLRGEKEVAVPPLALPPPADRPSTTDHRHANPVSGQWSVVTDYAAVQLFIQRASDARPDFQLTNANAAAVGEISARLDGLPLAIELAAARSKLFAPEALLARLSSRLGLLTGGARDLPARQQTLRNTIAWSYDLLTAAQQRLFRCLSVFVGGCTIEAAIAVCDATVDPNADVLEGLTALLDQNLLLQKEGADGEPRFTMLETIREYAIEQLAASGEAEALQLQHATYFLALVKTATPELTGPQQQVWLDRLEQEHDNLRAALTWSQSVGDAALGFRLAEALWPFWRARGYWSEGRDRLTGLLALTQHGDALSSLRAKALHGAGVLANCEGDYARAGVLCEQSLALFSELGDKSGMAWALNELGYVSQEQSDHEQATACCQESLTLFRELGDKRGVAEALDNLGRMARDQGYYARATTFFQESLTLFRELQDKRGVALALKSAGNMAWLQGNYATACSLDKESLRLFRELGDNWGAALSLTHLGMAAREQGDYAAAHALHEESLVLRRELGDKTGIAYSLHDLGIVVHRQGDNTQARTLLEESLGMFRRLRDIGGIALALNTLGQVIQSQCDTRRAASLFLESLALYQKIEFKPGIARTLEGLARVAGASRQPERAAHLFSAAVALREVAAIPLSAVDRADYDRVIAAVRAQLDDATFAAAWAAGLALPLEQAIAEALGASPIGNDASR